MPSRQKARSAPPSAAGDPNRPQRWLIPAALLLVTLVAYLPALRAGFIWDDDAYVTENTTLESLDGLRRIWFEIGATDQYYPLVFTSFWIEHHLWGENPLGYHFVNIVLHALSACLLWLILKRLAIPGAALAAAIFALHPVHVESVAWITERKNVLSGVFYLAAALTYLRFAGLTQPEIAAPRRRSTYALALILFLAALLSKTVTASLPAAILLLIWWKHGRLRLVDILPLIPFFALGLAAGLLTAWIESHHVGAGQIDWQLSFLDRCLIAGRAVCFYLTKLVFPAKLTFIYPRWQIDASNAVQFIYPLLVIAALVTLVILRKRIGRGPFAAAAFFVGTLFPALGFIDVYPMRFSFVADHFQYLASIGPIVLFAALAALLVKYTAVRVALTAALCLTLAALTFRQSRIYHDPTSLWQDTLAKNPDCWMAHGNLAAEYARAGRLDDAITHYREGLRLYSDAPQIEQRLADTLVLAGRPAEAIDHYRRSIDLAPDDLQTLTNLGTTLFSLQRYDEAAEAQRRVIELSPNAADARHNLAVTLAAAGHTDAAISELRTALKLDPQLAASHLQLGTLLFAHGQENDALHHFTEAARIEPDSFSARYNAAILLLKKGRAAEATREFEAALRIRPGDPQAQQGLAAPRQLLNQQ